MSEPGINFHSPPPDKSPLPRRRDERVYGKLALGIALVMLAAAVDIIVLIKVFTVDWNAIGGGNAAVISAILTLIVRDTIGLAKDVTADYFATGQRQSPPAPQRATDQTK